MSYLIKGINDLETISPELAEEWHPEKNGTVRPDMVTACSNRRFWWMCKMGHEWEAAVDDRRNGTGCPYCAGKRVIKGINDLATLCPDLAAEWHPTKNGELSPDDFMKRSGKKVWWMCKMGHEWEAIIANRSNGSGCPYCSGKRVIKGVNDLAFCNPALAGEWHSVKNGSLTPDMVTKYGRKKVWWMCTKGHEWRAVINNRNRGHGCPYCSRIRVVSK